MRKAVLLLLACVVLLAGVRMSMGFFASGAMGQGGGIVVPSSWIASDFTYTWWNRPAAAVYGGALYFTGVDRSANFKVGKVATDGTISSFTLLTSGVSSDDHDAPSITRMSNGKLLAAYTRHNLDTVVRYRISTSADDISAWATEATLSSSGDTSYTQTWVDSTGRVHLFYRSEVYRWAHRYSDDDGATWSSEKIFIQVGGSDFVYIATQPSPGDPDLLRVALVGHPINSTNHNIYYAELDLTTGDMSAPGGASEVNLYDASAAAASTDFELVYNANAASLNVRVFDIGSASAPQILFATFTDTLDAEYREARRVSGSWSVTTVVDAGSPMENPVGGNYYFAGMAATNNVDSIYVAREDASTRNWPLERYTYSSGWSVADTLLDGDWREYAETYRPIVPFGSDASFPVIAMRGLYEAYSGAPGHNEFSTSAVIDPSGEPAFSETVIYEQAFSGTAGAAVSGWSMLAKGTGIVNETFNVVETENFFGGKYGVMYHEKTSSGTSTIWGVTGSSSQNVHMTCDIRADAADQQIGFVARWVDSNNRVELRINFTSSARDFEIRERIAGSFSSTTGTVPAGIAEDDALRFEFILNGTAATGRLYQNGVLVLTVNRTLSATPAAGAFGLTSGGPGATVNTEVQKFLVVTP